MKKLLPILLIVLLCLSAPLSALAKAPTSTLADLRAETAEGWHETYTAHGRTIQIDAPITLPDTEAFPILTVRLAPAPLTQGEAAALMDGIATYSERDDEWVERFASGLGSLRLINRDGYFTYTRSASFDALCDEADWRTLDYRVGNLHLDALDWDAPLIDNSSLTLRDVEAFLYGQIERFFGTQVQGQLDQATIMGAYSTRKGKAVTPYGGYLLHYRQIFDGIPVLRRVLELYNQSEARLPAPEEHLGYGGEMTVYQADEQEYGLWLKLYTQQDTPYADVPLCSFATVKAELEKKIDAGLLRGVKSVQLGYIAYPDPKDNTLFWLLPGWVIEGDVYPDAKTELTKRQLKEGRGDMYTGTLAADGQRGTVFNARNNDRKRCVRPAIIGW